MRVVTGTERRMCSQSACMTTATPDKILLPYRHGLFGQSSSLDTLPSVHSHLLSYSPIVLAAWCRLSQATITSPSGPFHIIV